MVQISIICPVYNVQHYIRKCVDSIIAQSFHNWELIMIDDGSTDDSGLICDRYAETDKRITVIHQINTGVSAARQKGSDNANGKYVIHIDPDDYVEPNMLEKLYNAAIENDADVVICDFYVNELSGTISKVSQAPKSTKAESLLRALFQQLHGSCCNKLVKRACYNKYNIRFPEGINYCEDILFWVQLFSHKEIKVTYLSEAFYHYVMHQESITHNFTRSTYEIRIKYIKELQKLLPQSGYEKELRMSQLNVFFEAYMHDVLTKKESWMLLWKNKRSAFLDCKVLKYKLGYCLLLLGCFKVSRKLLRY